MCVSVCAYLYVYIGYFGHVYIYQEPQKELCIFFYNINDYNWTRQKPNEKYFTKR